MKGAPRERRSLVRPAPGRRHGAGALEPPVPEHRGDEPPPTEGMKPTRTGKRHDHLPGRRGGSRRLARPAAGTRRTEPSRRATAGARTPRRRHRKAARRRLRDDVRRRPVRQRLTAGPQPSAAPESAADGSQRPRFTSTAPKRRDSATSTCACLGGHPDGDDGEHLADDPIPEAADWARPGGPRHRGLATDDLAVREPRHADRAVSDAGRELATRIIRTPCGGLDSRARRIIIDLDPTDDRTHGAQELWLFNGYYDSWCYLPLLAFLTFYRDSDRYLCPAPVAPRHRPGHQGVSERAFLARDGPTWGDPSTHTRFSRLDSHRRITRPSSK